MSNNLLSTLAHDAEKIAETALPSITDLPKLFSGLVTRLEAELPKLAVYDIENLLAAAVDRQAEADQPAASASGAETEIVQDPDPVPDAQDKAPVETAAQRLRREANEAEAAEQSAQSEAAAGVASGAQQGTQVSGDAGPVGSA